MKFEGLLSLPWFLEYIARDFPTAKVFYVSNLNIIVPVVLINKNFLKIAYVPSPPNLIKNFSSFDFDLLKEIGKTVGYHILVMRVHPHDKVSGLRLIKNWFVVKDRADLSLNLKKSIAEIYFSFEKRTRYTLRKSLGLKDAELLRKLDEARLGEIIYEESSEKGVQLFSKLLKYQYTKIGLENGKNSKGLLRLYSYYDVENIKRVFTILGQEGLIRLFFAQKDASEPEVGMALFVSKKYLYSPMAYWWLGASTYSAEKKGLPTILQFFIINELKKEGYERYFLGGVEANFRQASSGPTLFKRGFTSDFKQGYLLIDVRGGLLNKLQFLRNPAIFRFIRRLANL